MTDFTHERQVARRPHFVAPTLASARVILVVKDDHPKKICSAAGLSITSQMTMKTLRRNGVHCNLWAAPNAEALKAKLRAEEYRTERPITHVVINTPGFIGPMCYGDMAVTWPEITFVMLNHTGLAYLSIDHDGWRNIRWLLDLQSNFDNIKVAGNNWRFVEAIEAEFGRPALLLPNLYDITTFKPLTQGPSCYSPLRIGSFAEGRPWKNQLVAAQAALSIARSVGASELHLYVNEDKWSDTKAMSEARRQLYEDLPQAKIVTIHWQPWHTFLRQVEHMHLLLYASFDESFGMVPADGIAVGVPSVTSDALEWTPQSWRAHQPFDPASITAAGISLLHGRLNAVQAGRKALIDYVDAGARRWIRFVSHNDYPLAVSA